MPDLYSTNTLRGIVDDLRGRAPANPSLLSLFFPAVIEEQSEEIHFDTANKPRRIAPFVSPLVEGKIVEELGFTTTTVKPAYVKDKRVLDPNRPFKRYMGEPIGGNASPEARRARIVSDNLADMLAMLRRRKEVMASEALRLGTVTISGEGFGTIVVNFGRDAALTIDLSGGASEWGDAGISPVANLEAWMALLLLKSGANATDVIFTPGAWSLFKADADFSKAVDLRRTPDSEVEFGPRVELGAALRGHLGTLRLWTYFDWYINSAGSEVPMIPDNTIIMGSGQIEGVQLHGAIRDEESGFQATELWPKTWVEQDPSVRYLMGQSAPLVAPFRPNASLSAIVT